MSFCESSKTFMQAGDVVLIYINPRKKYFITLKPGDTFQTQYGVLKHNTLIGKPFGHRFKCSQGHVYALQGDPELWTACLPHRTQILYTADISLIVFELGLVPGSIVIESGTGSGSLSHAIIRTIFPNGHLYTYDFHKLRCEEAAKEFKAHKLSPYITVEQRDVISSGFGGIKNLADAVFIDLPRPWEAVRHVKDSLKSEGGGRFGTFSPCIEQVQRTVRELEKEGFVDICTMECIRHTLEVNTVRFSDPFSKFNSSCTTLKKLRTDNTGDFTVPSALSSSNTVGHTGFLTFCSMSRIDHC